MFISDVLYADGDMFTSDVDMFQPHGHFECEHDCGFSSDDQNAVTAHEQVSNPFASTAIYLFYNLLFYNTTRRQTCSRGAGQLPRFGYPPPAAPLPFPRFGAHPF
jgi:hypothetical protein